MLLSAIKMVRLGVFPSACSFQTLDDNNL
jgi:hypothetical protein